MVMSKKPVTQEEQNAQHIVYRAAEMFCGTTNAQDFLGNIPPSIMEGFKKAFKIIEQTGINWQENLKEREQY